MLTKNGSFYSVNLVLCRQFETNDFFLLIDLVEITRIWNDRTWLFSVMVFLAPLDENLHDMDFVI